MLPQWRIGTRRVWFPVIVVVLCSIIIAGIIRAGTRPSAQPHSALPAQPTKPVPSIHLTVPVPVMPDPQVPYDGPKAATIGVSTLNVLAKRALPVVRLYASFPSAKGANYLLAQLKPLVTEAALADVRAQWQGSTGNVYAETKGTGVVMKADATSAHVVRVYAYISQSIGASDAPENFHVFGAIVTFTETGAIWHITRVSNDSQDYS